MSGYRRTVDSKLSTLVDLGQLGQPRSAAFSSSLTDFSFYAWPSNEAKYSHEVHLTLEGIEGTLRHMVPQDHPSTGASFFFFFLRRLLSEESDSDSLLLDSFRMRMAENRN